VLPADPERQAELRRRHDAIYGRPGLPCFTHWRIARRLYAGRNPLSELDAVELRALGMTHLLDLREEVEWSGPGSFGREAVEALARHGIERRHVPVLDLGAPSPEALREAVDWIDDVLSRFRPRLYVHCRAGVERTATVLVAWRARDQGLSLVAALDSLRRSGYPGRPLPSQLAAAERWLAGEERFWRP